MLQVKNAFTNMLAAKAALQVAQDNLNSYRKTLELSKVRLDAGDISRTDYERIDLQMAEFESDYQNAKLDLTQASDSLQLLMGIEKASPDFDIVGQLVPPAIVPTLLQLEQDALEHRPDYLAARPVCHAGRRQRENGGCRRNRRPHNRGRIRARWDF